MTGKQETRFQSSNTQKSGSFKAHTGDGALKALEKIKPNIKTIPKHQMHQLPHYKLKFHLKGSTT